jgi:hypothetical protein
MSETITVRWGGKDVVVSMLAVLGGCSYGYPANGVKLWRNPPYHVCFKPTYQVFAELPDPWQHGDHAEVCGAGATAQEALDDLAAQLRTLADWMHSVLNGSTEQKEGEQCSH